jgi:CheY-like chemotaxis protein
MPKRILLIDSDESFARGLAAAANAGGFKASAATNSEQGMTLARQESPDLIVVCVEAQPTNGYMICTRLKKDDGLKHIPVILTSANATEDSFEKHKKLKTRADDYLIKPFGAQAMLEMAARLLGLPANVAEEEVLSMDDESLGLGNGAAGDDEPIQLGEAEAAEAHSGSDDPVVELEELVEMDDAPAPVPEHGGGDEDLDMFDQAFDALKPAGGSGPIPVEKPRLRVAPDPEPEPRERRREPTELSAPTDDQFLGLDEESGLAGLEVVAPPRKAPSPPRAAAKARSGADQSVAELRQELDDREKQLAELQDQQSALEVQAQKLKDEAVKRDASAKALQQRADALAAAAKKFERELTAARDELKAGGGKSQAARLEGELEKGREEIAALTGEKDLLREERDELRKQLDESKASSRQNEERAIRAYQKMKGDEKLRERMRKALQIALALLEDGAVDTGTGSESEKKSA